MPYTWGTTGLCYRSDLVKAAPDSWNDLLKPADDLKGKTTMLSTDRWLMAAGFLANGMSVNTTDQASLDKVRDQLIAAKKNLLAYDDTTFYSKLVSGEAISGPGLGRLVQLRHRREAGDQVRGPQGRLGPVGRHHGRSPSPPRTRMRRTSSSTSCSTPTTASGWSRTSCTRRRTRPAWKPSTRPCSSNYPNMAIAPADLLKYEQLRDLGDGMKAFSKTVSEIMAAK